MKLEIGKLIFRYWFQSLRIQIPTQELATSNPKSQVAVSDYTIMYIPIRRADLHSNKFSDSLPILINAKFENCCFKVNGIHYFFFLIAKVLLVQNRREHSFYLMCIIDLPLLLLLYCPLSYVHNRPVPFFLSPLCA